MYNSLRCISSEHASDDYITRPIFKKTCVPFSYTSYLYQHSIDFRVNRAGYEWTQKFENEFLLHKIHFTNLFSIALKRNCTTKPQHWAKLHNEITTLGKTAQRNHNTGQNFTTKSQHWTKLYNRITTLGKTAQRNHSEVQVLRSSRPEALCKKCVLRDFAKFKGKRLCQILLFNKVVGLRSANLLKKSLWHRCFPVNFAKFLRTTFFTEHIR